MRSAETTRLHELAQDTLEVFAGVAGQFGIYAGTYGLASVWMARAHTQVVVIGEGAEADALYAEALAPFALNKIVLRVKDRGKPAGRSAAGARGNHLRRPWPAGGTRSRHALQRLRLPASHPHRQRVTR